MPHEMTAAEAGADAFRAFYEANVADVWAFARRRCASRADADDVTSETFAVAWRRWEEVPTESARLWLFGAARLVLSNHHRSTRRQERLHLRLVQTSGPDVAEQAVPDDTLLRALGSLDEADRDLLIMRAWDGLAVTEMATLLDVTPNAVSVRLTKARGRLATALARLEENGKDREGAGHVRPDATPHGKDAR